MVVAVPRPPHRSHSLGSSSSVVNSTLGGAINKHVGVERLRHSISVARGHHTSNHGNINSNNNSYSNGSSGHNSRAGSHVSTPAASQGDNYAQGKSIGSSGGKIALVRRNSGHSVSGGGGGGGSSSGWTGANQAPSYKLSVTTAGSGVSSVGGGSARLDEAGARQRGMRPAQQVF